MRSEKPTLGFLHASIRVIHPPVRRHFTRKLTYRILHVERPDDI